MTGISFKEILTVLNETGKRVYQRKLPKNQSVRKWMNKM